MTVSILLKRILKSLPRMRSAALITLATLLLVVTFALASPQVRPHLQSGASSVVSYQGQVKVDGTPYSGTGYFKFAILDEGDTSQWSNDGTSVAGGEPSAAVVLTVSNGLFNVLLGDGMEALEASDFDGVTRYLRVWFSSDNVTFTQLSPDRRFAAVPYALQAEQAADADTLDGKHASELVLPSGAMVLSNSANDTTLISAGFTYTDQTVITDSWTIKAAMPTGRYGLAAETVGGVIYTIGGNTGGYSNKNEAYDPATNSWSEKTAMPTGRRYLAAAAVDGVIYVIGGQSAAENYENKNEAYDPVANAWSTKAAMPTGRSTLTATAVDGVVYAIGGHTGSFSNKNEAYDPVANAWSTKADMPTGRATLTATAVDGVIYAIGGTSGGMGGDFLNINEAYNPVGNTWSIKTAMPTGRRYLAAAAVDGVIYVIGGQSASSPVYENKNEAFKPFSNSWSEKAAMPTARYYLSAAAVDGVVYVIGGYSAAESYENKNEAYKPALYVYVKD